MSITLNGTTGITSSGDITLNNGNADGAQVTLTSSGYSNWNIDNYSGRFRAYYNATEYFTIDTSGNVGIGTTSPFSAAGYKSLTINGSTTGILALQANGTNSCYLYSDGSAFNFKGLQNIPLDFYTNDTYRMRIDTSGNLLVGGTANVGPGSGRIAITSPDLFNTVAGLGVKNNANNTGGSFAFWVNSSNSIIGTISQNSSTTVGYNTSSDYRLKENIAPMTGALDKVSALKPVTYTWKADGSDGQGFIAHELAEIIPDAVSGEKDAVNEDGSIKAQGVDTSFLVATLTAAIQEQQTIINDLKARVTALEASNV